MWHFSTDVSIEQKRMLMMDRIHYFIMLLYFFISQPFALSSLDW
jgi:hypothetical protein